MCEKANLDIRTAITDAGLNYYHVAKEYGLTDANFSRLLRFELEDEKKQRVFKAIEVAKEKYL